MKRVREKVDSHGNITFQAAQVADEIIDIYFEATRRVRDFCRTARTWRVEHLSSSVLTVTLSYYDFSECRMIIQVGMLNRKDESRGAAAGWDVYSVRLFDGARNPIRPWTYICESLDDFTNASFAFGCSAHRAKVFQQLTDGRFIEGSVVVLSGPNPERVTIRIRPSAEDLEGRTVLHRFAYRNVDEFVTAQNLAEAHHSAILRPVS